MRSCLTSAECAFMCDFNLLRQRLMRVAGLPQQHCRWLFQCCYIPTLDVMRDCHAELLWTEVVLGMLCKFERCTSHLQVLRGKPAKEFPKFWKEWSVTKLCFEKDFEPYAIERDTEIEQLARKEGQWPTLSANLEADSLMMKLACSCSHSESSSCGILRGHPAGREIVLELHIPNLECQRLPYQVFQACT